MRSRGTIRCLSSDALLDYQVEDKLDELKNLVIEEGLRTSSPAPWEPFVPSIYEFAVKRCRRGCPKEPIIWGPLVQQPAPAP